MSIYKFSRFYALIFLNNKDFSNFSHLKVKCPCVLKRTLTLTQPADFSPRTFYIRNAGSQHQNSLFAAYMLHDAGWLVSKVNQYQSSSMAFHNKKCKWAQRKLSLFIMTKAVDEEWIISREFLSLNALSGVCITPKLIALTDQRMQMINAKFRDFLYFLGSETFLYFYKVFVFLLESSALLMTV